VHHRKEGWPSDQEDIAKPPLIARPGWFSDGCKRKTTPAASAAVASRNFVDDAAISPCLRLRAVALALRGDAKKGMMLLRADRILFHSFGGQSPREA